MVTARSRVPVRYLACLFTATVVVATAAFADPGDAVDPYGSRAVAVRLVLQLVFFFVFLVGFIAWVMRKDRRAKRQRELAAAGLGPPPAPEPAIGFELPLRKVAVPPHARRWRMSIGAGGLLAAGAVVVIAADRGLGWEVAAAFGAFVAWLALATTRGWDTPPVRLRGVTTPDGAVLARGPPAGMSPVVALLPMLLVLVCWANATTPASRLIGLLAATIPLSAVLVDWGLSREELRATPEALERCSPWLRRRRRLAWREVIEVLVFRSDPREPHLLVTTRALPGSLRLFGPRFIVPLSLDGVGDLVAVLLREVPPAVWTQAEPGARELLEALAGATPPAVERGAADSRRSI
jgi:hypothetical protein